MWYTLLVGARFLQFAGALVLLGSALFYLYGLRTTAAPWTRRVLCLSALAATAGTILWVMGEAVLISGEPGDGTSPAAIWLVFSETRFGRACLWRLGALLVSLAATLIVTSARTLWSLQVALASFVIVTFPWTGHGASSPGWLGMVHLGGDILHLWTAGVWLGALVPLAILIARAAQSRTAADAFAASHGLERFSAVGTWVVAALVLSGLINSWFLIGPANWRAVFSTAYGITLLVKLGLFALMLVPAAANRFWLTPGLRSGQDMRDAGPALQMVKVSVLVETAIATLVLIAVAVLGTLVPPAPT